MEKKELNEKLLSPLLWLEDAEGRCKADLAGADLAGAYLRGAYLRGADLRGAYLRGADFREAISCFDETVDSLPVQVCGLKWEVLIWGSYLKIGCKIYKIEEWKKFTQEEILKMDANALDFYDDYKVIILELCKKTNKEG